MSDTTTSNVTHRKISNMGMELEEWQFKSCTAQVGSGDGWATIFSIESSDKNKGHGTQLLLEMKKYYESKSIDFGSSVALSPEMKHLLTKLNITEYR